MQEKKEIIAGIFLTLLLGGILIFVNSRSVFHEKNQEVIRILYELNCTYILHNSFACIRKFSLMLAMAGEEC